MPTMRDLVEQRGEIVNSMRALTEIPTGDGGDLSDAEAGKFDQLKSDLGKVEKRIERQTVLDEAQRRVAAPAIIHGNGRDGNFENRAREFSLVKAILHRLGEEVDDRFRARDQRRGPPPRAAQFRRHRGPRPIFPRAPGD